MFRFKNKSLKWSLNMDWVKILEVVAGAGVLLSILRWLFLPSYRLSLRKKDFGEFSTETDTLIDFCKVFEQDPTSKSEIQLQNAFNQFLGYSKYHYSVFFEKFKSLWDFKSKFSDLKYSGFLITQKVENNKAKLYYRFKESTLKRGEKISIAIIIAGSILYILLIIFEFSVLNILITKEHFSQSSYDQFKLYSLLVFVLCYATAALLGSKFGVALSLKDTFDIQEKN